MRGLYAFTAAAMLSGCASNLQIFRDVGGGQAGLVAGVPFHTPELWVKEGVFTKLQKGGECDRTAFVEVEALPLGPMYYAAVKPAQLAKTGFAMKFNDKGSLSEISLNTEPSTDALKNAGELIKTVAPILGVGAAAPPLTGSHPACDAGPDKVKYTRFDDWRTTHP